MFKNKVSLFSLLFQVGGWMGGDEWIIPGGWAGRRSAVCWREGGNKLYNIYEKSN